MRWLHNISFSSPATSSSTASPVSDHHHNHLLHSRSHSSNLNGNTTNNNNNNNNNNNSNNELRGPRLTRQKKLRHLTDHEIGEVTKFTPDKAETITLTRSKSNYDHFPSSSSSSTAAAVPLPLPLPLPVPEENGDSRLVSPRETAAAAHGRAVEERDRDGVRDRDRIGRAGEVVSSSNSPVASKFASHAAKKNPEHKEKRHSKSPRQGLNAAEQDNFRLNIPTKSAPTSPFGSPVLSPKRTSASGMFQYYCKVPDGNQGWSAPEMPTLDIPGLPPPAFFDYTALSADSSPFHSPRSRSPCKNPRSPTGSSSPIHPKMSRENNGHLEVHPLPLPPGATMSSPLASTPQVPAMNSQWQKGKPIGRGTFGSVYVATNRETGALCAMKEVEIFPDDPKSAECIKQLEQEIKVLSQLRHPNIVQYYGSEIVEDKFYIYLEYVHPGSINKYVREHCGAITESVIRNFTRHIVSGLAYLHSKKTIHRDIKGANLLVDASGVVKLADFGMAKLLTGQAADLSLKGSPYWMAPELMMAVMQKDSSSDLALAVDIWSLGCTIIEMFTGKPPWSEYEGAAAMFKVMRDTPPIPESLSAEARDFLRCCFRRNPAERPSASMLLEHRFLKSSPHIDVPSCSLSFSAMKLTEKSVSPQKRSETKGDQLHTLPNSPSTRSMTTSESENAVQQRSRHETSDLTVASSHYSPRSILEAPPLLSPSYEAPLVLPPSREAQHAVSPPREVHYTMSPPRESHYVMSPPREAHYIMSPPREAHYELSPPREAHYVITPPRSMSPPLEARYAMSPPHEALFLLSPPREASPPNLSPPRETRHILSPSHPGQSRNRPSPSAIARGGPNRSQI